jgi:molecular chaperone DnaK
LTIDVRNTPSSIRFNNNDIVIGHFAHKTRFSAGSLFYGTQIFLGMSVDETNFKMAIPYAHKLSVSSNNSDLRSEVQFSSNGKNLTPSNVCTHIARDLLKTALSKENQASTYISAISHPVYFNDAQTRTLIQSVRDAGFNCVVAIKDPIAAVLGAIECGYFHTEKAGAVVAVIDVGGRCTQITCVQVDAGKLPSILSQRVLFNVGGDFFDKVIVDSLAKDFQTTHGVNLLDDPTATQRLHDAAERAKVELAISMATDINIPFITADARGPKHINTQLNRSKFELLVSPLFEQISTPIDEVLNEANIGNISLNSLDSVLLVGGGARIPFIKDYISNLLKVNLISSLEPEELVCIGAAASLEKM